jgi:hypothetical protein
MALAVAMGERNLSRLTLAHIQQQSVLPAGTRRCTFHPMTDYWVAI